MKHELKYIQGERLCLSLCLKGVMSYRKCMCECECEIGCECECECEIVCECESECEMVFVLKDVAMYGVMYIKPQEIR